MIADHGFGIQIVGIFMHAVGAILMVRFRRLENPTWELVLSQVIAGAGGGFTTLGAQLGVQAVVSHQDVGIATAVFLTITQVGQSRRLPRTNVGDRG